MKEMEKELVCVLDCCADCNPISIVQTGTGYCRCLCFLGKGLHAVACTPAMVSYWTEEASLWSNALREVECDTEFLSNSTSGGRRPARHTHTLKATT